MNKLIVPRLGLLIGLAGSIRGGQKLGHQFKGRPFRLLLARQRLETVMLWYRNCNLAYVIVINSTKSSIIKLHFLLAKNYLKHDGHGP